MQHPKYRLFVENKKVYIKDFFLEICSAELLILEVNKERWDVVEQFMITFCSAHRHMKCFVSVD